MINTIFTIAYRDFIKFVRDRQRIVGSFIFPLIFVGLVGSSFQANLGQAAGYNFLLFTVLGTMAQTCFQSTASGIISLLKDSEEDFAQEMFIAPVSKWQIVLGKVIGESSISLIMLVPQILIVLALGIEFNFLKLLPMLPLFFLICMLGGSFGLLLISFSNSSQGANQIFPFLLFPQYFLGGVFNPIKNLPLPTMILSRIMPLTYAVDMIRSFYYTSEQAAKTTINSFVVDLLVVSVMTAVFFVVGSYLFTRKKV